MLKKCLETPSELKNLKVTKEILEELIPSNIDLSSQTPKEIYEDIVSYLKTKDEPCSEESLKCKFMYFATSVIHIFKDSAICHKPYVCINVSSEGKMIIFRHQGIDNGDKFRVCLQIVNNIKDIQMVKTCTNLYTLEVCAYNNGNAVHICLRKDLNALMFVKPNAVCDFITILYYNNKFSGVYHKTSIKLICAIH